MTEQYWSKYWGLVRQVGKEFEHARWNCEREVHIGYAHQALHSELGKLPWENDWDTGSATSMTNVCSRDMFMRRDENGNVLFREIPLLDAAGEPIVNGAGDAFDVVLPASRFVYLRGAQRDVARISQVAERAGKLMLALRRDIGIKFTPWRFSQPVGVFWYALFELAFSNSHPLLHATKKLYIAGSRTSYPYDIEAVKHFRSSEFGGFETSLPAEWETELPDAWISDLDDGLAACFDAWTYFYPEKEEKPVPPMPVDPQPKVTLAKRFRVAMSFPGSRRPFVKEVVDLLVPALKQQHILYDHFNKTEFGRRDLDIYLPQLYRSESELVVVFASKDYAERDWCGLEWAQMRSVLKDIHSNPWALLVAKFEDVELPGFPDVHGYVSIAAMTAREVADMIIERLMMLKESALKN